MYFVLSQVCSNAVLIKIKITAYVHDTLYTSTKQCMFSRISIYLRCILAIDLSIGKQLIEINGTIAFIAVSRDSSLTPSKITPFNGCDTICLLLCAFLWVLPSCGLVRWSHQWRHQNSKTLLRAAPSVESRLVLILRL
jgi:hypothetical protein